MLADVHKRVVIGVEIEAYSIDPALLRIGRRLSRPRRGLSEDGEWFKRDKSIGSEYNSRPFVTIREALFLLRTGLRKYFHCFYRSRSTTDRHPVPLLVGSWTNRVAGTHLHVSVADLELTAPKAASLAFHVHDHLPLLIAVGANSPVWGRKVTPFASNRLLHGSDHYFAPLRRGELPVDARTEMCLVPPRGDKPQTLEIRALDSNLPDFVVTTMCLLKAIVLRWRRREAATNRIRHDDYLLAREQAARHGMGGRLCWRGQWLETPAYLERFLEVHHRELERMDVPPEVWHVLGWLKQGYNGAELLRRAALQAHAEHPQTWQRRFAKRYVEGLELLLSGNTLSDFVERLGIEPPAGAEDRGGGMGVELGA